MRPVVLVGSLSEARLIQYQAELESYELRVDVLSKDEDYFQRLAESSWGSLLLECSMIWGNSSMECHDDDDRAHWRTTPLVLFGSTGSFARSMEGVRIPILGLFEQFPCRNELMSAISSAWKSEDAFVVEAPLPEHEWCRG